MCLADVVSSSFMPLCAEVLAPLFVCAGTEWLVPKSPVAFHSLGLLPVCIVPALCGGRSHVLAPLQLCPLRLIA